MTVLDYASGAQRKSDLLSRITNHWLSWAVYLGMSWTWCIGMFLPVLLIRDYGLWAWFVFAIPNVVGAAAMGWVLKDGKSEQLVAHHQLGLSAFSFVTTTFQIFFALWMFQDETMLVTCTILVVATVCLLLMWLRAPIANHLCIAAFVVCVYCIAKYTDGHPFDVKFADYGIRFYPELLGLLPVCIFGFGLCPYLDGTFHHARMSQPRVQARSAFTVGFGIVFLLMIAFTFVYAHDFIFRGFPWHRFRQMREWVPLYLTIQLALTIALHWHIRPKRWIHATASVAVAFVVWWLSGWIHVSGMQSGEFVYRLFMAFYGLVFPAYVWLCMLPTWKAPQTPTRRMWIVLGVAVLLASPFYWVGFIAGKMFWVLPGLGIALLARLFVPWRKALVTAYN